MEILNRFVLPDILDPVLFLAEYFDTLTNQIDLFYEEQLASIQDCCLLEKLQTNRNLILKQIFTHKNNCLVNFRLNLDDITNRFGAIAAKFNVAHPVMNQINVDSFISDFFRLKRDILLNKTFVFTSCMCNEKMSQGALVKINFYLDDFYVSLIK